MGDTNDIPLDR
jgi:hypothetical protein